MNDIDVMSKLYPCPFCGGQARGIEESAGHYYVQCTCGATGPTAETQDAAVEAWNKDSCLRVPREPSDLFTAVRDELLASDGPTLVLTANILMYWNRKKIERFARHLLGEDDTHETP